MKSYTYKSENGQASYTQVNMYKRWVVIPGEERNGEVLNSDWENFERTKKPFHTSDILENGTVKREGELESYLQWHEFVTGLWIDAQKGSLDSSMVIRQCLRLKAVDKEQPVQGEAEYPTYGYLDSALNSNSYHRIQPITQRQREENPEAVDSPYREYLEFRFIAGNNKSDSFVDKINKPAHQEAILKLKNSEISQPKIENKEELHWIKATTRLPELPKSLPLDTEDERGVLFVNRNHSTGAFWYPSYGVSAKDFLENHNGWPIEQWEWLEENINHV